LKGNRREAASLCRAAIRETIRSLARFIARVMAHETSNLTEGAIE
jgi:hypothetical protein